MVSKLSDKNIAELRDSLNELTERNGSVADEEAIRLACAGQIDQAVEALEQLLHGDPANYRLRLWWVWSQLHRGGLPVAALTAPLEEMLDELMQDSTLAYLSADTFLRAGLLLEKRSKRRLSLIMLERASEVSANASEFTEQLRNQILQIYLEVLSDEIALREEKFETGKSLDRLKTKRKEFSKRLVKVKPQKKVSEESKVHKKTKAKKQTFSSKTIREEAFSEPVEKVDPEPEVGSADAIESTFIEAESADDTNKGKSSLAIWLRVALLASGAYAVYVFWPMIDFGAVPTDAIARPSTVFVQHEKPKLPALVPRATAMGAAKLRKVESRLELLARSKEDHERAAAQNVSSDVDHEMMAALERKAEANSELVALKKPSGPDGFNKPSEQTPELRPERLPPAKVRDLGYSPPPNTSPNVRYQRGADGRLYGPPPGSLQGGNKQALDGSDLRAYEVERLSTPLMYRTITATNVVEAPSVLAATIGRLKADVKIQVVSRMGKWLELRSTGGRRGYIFSQDAVKMSDSLSQ